MQGKPFTKGHTKVGGRRKGVPNKTHAEVRALAQLLVSDEAYLENLTQRLRDGKAGPIEPLLWHYAYGKPNASLDETEELSPRTVDLSDFTDEELAQRSSFF